MRVVTVTATAHGRTTSAWSGRSRGQKCTTCNRTLKAGERVLAHQTNRMNVYIHIDCLALLLAEEETFELRKKLMVEEQLLEIAQTEARFQSIRQSLATEHGVVL